MDFKKYLLDIMPSVTAEAHCDIPCGIYDPTPAKIAARTVVRMIMQIEDTHPPKDTQSVHEMSHYMNAIGRRVAVKEEHARICKHELLTLWSDFFKAEHLVKYPNLHELFWNAVKLCSKVKQDVDKESADKLVVAVDEIAKIFYDAKGDLNRFNAYKEVTDKLF